MPGTGAKLIDRFSAARVRTALSDTPVVDVVVENDRGALIGIDAKAAATVVAADFKGLRKLAVASREGFKLGVVLYDGERIVPFGERLFAAPISCVCG